MNMRERTKNRSYEIDMCSGAILPKMIRFALPLMLSNMLQRLFNTADVIVVGRFAGEDSLAAVGSTGNLVALPTNFFIGLSIGANVLASRYYGAGDDKALRETVHTSVLLSLISGVVLTVLGLSLSGPLLGLLNVPEEIFDKTALYLRIYFLGMTATMVYNFCNAILSAVGDTKRPMYYLTFAGVVNVILNLIFVIGFEMDVGGVALATVISQCISAGLVLRCLIRTEGPMKLDLKALKVEPQKFRMIASIGVPASVQGVLLSVSNLTVQSSLNSFGATAVAAESAGANIDGFIHSATNAFYQAVLSFTGQNMGAGRRDRINKVLFAGIGCSVVIGLSLSFGVICFGEFFLGLYTTSAAVITMGLDRMRIMTRVCFLNGLQGVAAGVMRGMGFSTSTMVVSLIGTCGFRLLYVVLSSRIEQFHTLQMLYITYPVTWGFIFVVLMLCYWRIRRGWTKN